MKPKNTWKRFHVKSDNLQCNRLVCWAHGTNYLSTKRLNFFFFYFFIDMGTQNSLFSFCNFIRLERVFAKNFARFYEEKKYLEHQTLGRRFVCPIGPVTQREFILDWRISWLVLTMFASSISRLVSPLMKTGNWFCLEIW